MFSPSLRHKTKILSRSTALALLMMPVLAIPSYAAEPVNIEDLPPQPVQSAVPDDVISADEMQNLFREELEISQEPLARDEAVEMPVPEIVNVTPVKEVIVQTQVVPEPTNELPAPVPDQQAFEQQQPDLQPVPHSGTYYDSNSIGPSDLGQARAPRKVDPKYEPGSSFVVVERNASASSRQAQLVAAQRALKLGRYSSALEIYERLYKKSPRNSQILMGLAVAQQSNGFNESAIATYQELLKISPRHTGAMVNLQGLMQQRSPAASYKKLQKLWSKNTQNPVVAAQLGLASASMGDGEGAMRYLGIAASLEPQNALHFYNLAVVLDQSSSHAEAIKYYQKALEVDASHSGGRILSRDEVYDRLAQLRRL